MLTFLLPTTAAAEGLTIEDAVRLALQNNERARKAPLRVEIAEGQLERARDAFFPTLVGSGATTYKPDPGRNPSTTTSGALTLSQPLFNPSAFPQYAQQKHSLESEKWGSVQDKRQVAFDTAKAFIQALTLEHVQDSAKRKADTAKISLEAARARADAGLASTNDVTKAELQLATSLGQVATTQGNVVKAYISLSFLVGQKVAPPLVPPDNTTRAAAAVRRVTAKPGEERARSPGRGTQSRAGSKARRAITSREDGGTPLVRPRAELQAHSFDQRVRPDALRGRSAPIREGRRRTGQPEPHAGRSSTRGSAMPIAGNASPR